MLRTKEQYRERLFNMKPNVCIGGKMVRRDDPRLIPGVRVLDLTFDVAQDPKWKGLATATSSVTGGEINRWSHLPQKSLRPDAEAKTHPPHGQTGGRLYPALHGP